MSEKDVKKNKKNEVSKIDNKKVDIKDDNIKKDDVDKNKNSKSKKSQDAKTEKQSKKDNIKPKENIENIVNSTVKTKQKPKRDMNELISVICITNNPLVYESKSQAGYRVDWDGYLSENWIEYKELVNMRGSQRAFFEQPWIICDWDVLVDLKVDHYYKNIIDLQDLDSVFKKSAEELTETLKIVPDGIKSLIVDRAFELRRKKKLDSLSVIETIEKTLNIDLSV